MLALRPTLFERIRRVADDDAVPPLAGLCPSDGCNSEVVPDLRVDCIRRREEFPEASTELVALLAAIPFGGSTSSLSAAAARRLLLPAPPDLVRDGAVRERGIARPGVGKWISSSSSFMSLDSSSSSVGAVFSDPVLLFVLGCC